MVHSPSTPILIDLMSSSPSQSFDRDFILKPIKPYLAKNWNIEEETGEYFTISKNEATFNGHVLVFILFGWWTLLIPNIIYHMKSARRLRIAKREK
jgi:hypothetical protein